MKSRQRVKAMVRPCASVNRSGASRNLLFFAPPFSVAPSSAARSTRGEGAAPSRSLDSVACAPATFQSKTTANITKMKPEIVSQTMTVLSRNPLMLPSLRPSHVIVILLASACAQLSAFAKETGISAVPYSEAKDRPGWRFCNKCDVLFYQSGKPGSCAAGGNHVAQGFLFRMPINAKGTPTAQTDWRECENCHAMFYNGLPKKGLCPSVSNVHNGVKGFGPHEANSTFKYVLPHDVVGTPTAQTGWRGCGKCSAMFYDGFPAKGRCPGGEGHLAAGYKFVLPHSPVK